MISVAPKVSDRTTPGIVAPGAGLAILVNAQAKRGGRRVAAQIARVLPGASVRVTKSPAEVDAWLAGLHAVRGILAAGGDGTAIALVNAFARVMPGRTPWPPMGVLPLGTGNGWAHALGTPKLHRCLELLANTADPLPVREMGLVEVEGTLAHFAGSGWDAMILDDYKRQLRATKGPGRRLSKTVYGYMLAALLRTAPKVLWFGSPRLIVENLGDEVYGLDRTGRPFRMSSARRGTILYDGPAGAASAGTCPEYGYHFRAFPFAERMPGFINVRVYSRGPFGAVASIPLLWRGAHPLPGMHDWLATGVRMTFSRPVPLQIGGDAFGLHRTVDYHAVPKSVRMIDWRRIAP